MFETDIIGNLSKYLPTFLYFYQVSQFSLSQFNWIRVGGFFCQFTLLYIVRIFGCQSIYRLFDFFIGATLVALFWRMIRNFIRMQRD